MVWATFLSGHDGDHELHLIVRLSARGGQAAAKLQITPVQGSDGSVEYEARAMRRAFDSHLDETLEVWGTIEIKDA